MSLDWTLTELLEILMAQLQLEGEYRMRDLSHEKMFYKEEMGFKLRNYEIFREGGTRI